MSGRLTGYGLRGYGIGAIAIGLLMIFAGSAATLSDLTSVGALVLAIGVAMCYYSVDRWYCEMCGQAQGRILRPRACDRCDSNRMAKQDPGVGDAVRVQR